MKITIFDAIKIEGTKEEIFDVSIDIVNMFMKETIQCADERDDLEKYERYEELEREQHEENI